jgi:acyl dehydratase
MMTFSDFIPGATIGSSNFAFDDAAAAAWTGLFPDDAAGLPAMPSAMIAMVVMRAFMSVLPARPPGNVHAAQKFQICRLPSLGEGLLTSITCLGKEIKNNRKWVTLDSETLDTAGTVMFRGQMTTIWAT